jgi:excisionase family DNA binding protein
MRLTLSAASSDLRPASSVPSCAVYTVSEVAQLLSLSRGVAYELVRDGTIPAHRLGRRWVVPRARFHAWLDGDPDTGGRGAQPGGR